MKGNGQAKHKLYCPWCKCLICETEDCTIVGTKSILILEGNSRLICPTCNAALIVTGDLKGGLTLRLEGHVTP